MERVKVCFTPDWLSRLDEAIEILEERGFEPVEIRLPAQLYTALLNAIQIYDEDTTIEEIEHLPVKKITRKGAEEIEIVANLTARGGVF